MKSAAERKADQRARDRANGWLEVPVKIHKSDKPKILALAKRLNAERKAKAKGRVG